MKTHSLVSPGASPHEQYLERHPAEAAELYDSCLRTTEELLASLEKQPNDGVYTKGARKGQPYDARRRHQIEKHARKVRGALAYIRGEEV